MASYRPKSLNELNNLYGKSMAAQNAIKNNGSAITDSGSDKERDYSQAYAEDLQPKEKTAAQIASDELSDALSDFIKNFGESDKSDKEKSAVRQPLPIAKVIKPSTPVSNKPDRSAEHPVSKLDTTKSAQEDAPAAKKEKPVLMRNSERSELLDDYMKIMNDEDDDMEFLKNIVKKKKKNKKDKHQGSPLFEEKKEEPIAEEDAGEDETELPSEADEAVNAEVQSAENEAEEFSSFYKEEEEEEAEPEENTEEASQPAPAKKGKKIFLQIILMLILLVVLVSAVTVGLMKVVVGVDSGNAFMDKYYVFTADQSFTEAKINEGDLVITESKDFAQNDSFAYTKTGSGETVFAVKGIQIDSERFMAHSDNEVELVYKNNVKGAVIKAIPTVGAFVGILMDNFIIVVSALVALSLILILVIALAFRSKSAYTIDDSQEIEEEVEEAEDGSSYENEAEEDGSDENDYAKKEVGLFSSID